MRVKKVMKDAKLCAVNAMNNKDTPASINPKPDTTITPATLFTLLLKKLREFFLSLTRRRVIKDRRQ